MATTPWQHGTGWSEAFLGGSASAEARLFEAFARQIRLVQKQIRAHEHAPVIRRAFHAKIHAGVTNAAFRILPTLPMQLGVGFIQPGAVYPATVRFSNASGAIRPDAKRDLRGIAVRVHAGHGTVHDFLMTNAAASHARDARQFMVAAIAMASSQRITVVPKLVRGLGSRDAVRMMAIVVRSARKVDSVATERFWSRSPITFGPLAVKFMLQPAAPVPLGCAAREGTSTDDYLRDDLTERLLRGPVTFDFRVQRYVDGRRTPIEDGTIEWRESDAPPETVAQLFIPQQDLRTADARAAEEVVDRMEFNPWNTTDEFRPLGSLNRARKLVYIASADYRAGRPVHTEGLRGDDGTPTSPPNQG